jgi:hypothetical protein
VRPSRLLDECGGGGGWASTEAAKSAVVLLAVAAQATAAAALFVADDCWRRAIIMKRRPPQFNPLPFIVLAGRFFFVFHDFRGILNISCYGRMFLMENLWQAENSFSFTQVCLVVVFSMISIWGSLIKTFKP